MTFRPLRTFTRDGNLHDFLLWGQERLATPGESDRFIILSISVPNFGRRIFELEMR
jgi:hypothetical protein